MIFILWPANFCNMALMSTNTWKAIISQLYITHAIIKMHRLSNGCSKIKQKHLLKVFLEKKVLYILPAATEISRSWKNFYNMVPALKMPPNQVIYPSTTQLHKETKKHCGF